MFKKTGIVLFCIFLVFSLYAKPRPEKLSIWYHPIYHSLLKLNRSLPKEKAWKYSNIMARLCKKERLNPFLVVAIARQESGIVLNEVREKFNPTVIEENGNYFRKIRITDFCMMQINERNVKTKKLDPNKLLSDPEYCISEGIEILTDFKYLKEKDAFWWTRYNAVSEEKREEYKNYVLGHYKKLEKFIPNFEKIIERYVNQN